MVAGAKVIKKDFEAVLVATSDGTNEKVGRAKWKHYAGDNTKLSVIINSLTRKFTGPFVVYLNGVSVGETKSESASGPSGQVIIFHKLTLESKNGATVPAVKEGDAVSLTAADGTTISGRFMPD